MHRYLRKRQVRRFNSPENVRCQLHLELEEIPQKVRNQIQGTLMIVAQAGGSHRSSSGEVRIGQPGAGRFPCLKGLVLQES